MIVVIVVVVVVVVVGVVGVVVASLMLWLCFELAVTRETENQLQIM